MDGVTKKEITELTKLTPRQVQFYTEERVIRPEVDKGEGRGKVRRYSKNNVIEFLLVRELAKYNIALYTLKRIIEKVRKEVLSNVIWINERPEQKERVSLIVYDPGEKKIHFIIRTDKTADKISVKMQGYSSALVIDITNLASQLKSI